jgi:hypothetical protein
MEPTTSKTSTKPEPEGAATKAVAIRKTKADKKAATKQPKLARENEPRQREQFDGEVVVFAFRLGSNDRDRIHAAAGPAGATRFVRSAALAAATGDAKAFEALILQAKSNLK